MQGYVTKIIQGMAIALGVLILLLALSDVPELLRSLRGFTLWLLIPITLLKLINYTFRYLEWHYLLGVVGVRIRAGLPSTHQPPTLNLGESIAIFLAGFPMQLSPGKVAEVLKAAMVKHRTRVPIAQTAPVVLTERIVDGLAVLIIIGVAALLGGEAIFGSADLDIDAATIQALVIGTFVAMVGAIVAIQIKPLGLGVLDILAKIPLLRRFVPWLRHFYLSSYEVLKLRRLIPTVGFGLVAYGTDCIALYLMLRGVDVAGSADLMAQVSFILGFAVIVAALSAMPGGAGARELSIGGLLIGMVGLERGVASAAVAINTFFQVGLGVLIGLVVLVIFRRRLIPDQLDNLLAEDGG